MYVGGCLCGAIELRIEGKPAAMGFCHCISCRQWSASPVNAFTPWQPMAVTIVRGAMLIGTFARSERAVRKWCTRCGEHLFTEHPRWGLPDGLPKMKDLPAPMGGTGVTMPE